MGLAFDRHEPVTATYCTRGTTIVCPVCQRANPQQLARPPALNDALVAVYKCKGCGFVYAPKPRE